MEVSLNPLPGEATSFYERVDELQVNAVTPYSTLGELRNYGAVPFGAYFLAAGAYFAHLQAFSRRLPQAWQAAFTVALAGLAVMFATTSLQYTLRTTTRLLYYAVVAELAVRLILVLRSPAPRARLAA
jgi:catechol-2,3-dioxygenase